PWQRALLYPLALVFAALSVVQAALAPLPEAVGYGCYGLAALFLAAGCLDLTTAVKTLTAAARDRIAAHPLANRVSGDYRLRTIVFSIPGAGADILFALTNGVAAVLSRSPWLGTLAAYYIVLSLMRVNAVVQAKQIAGMENGALRLQKEIGVYQKNSALFLCLAVTLAGMVALLEREVGGKTYPGLMIYAAAAYTFYKITRAALHVVKVKRHRSPLVTILRKIGYVDACVSILTLQTAMFAAFLEEDRRQFARLMNGATGGTVCLLLAVFGVQGLLTAKRMKARN
ncbi:MAG: hypothetical protein LUF80_02885, partial [Oscillospiraceae bacterium]|nr:hypothetical protein [Oscillospiraceae bacterium]